VKGQPAHYKRVRKGVPLFVICCLIVIGAALSVRGPSAHAQGGTLPPTVSAAPIQGPFTIHGPVYMGTATVQVTEDLVYLLSVFRGDPAKVAQGATDSVTEVYTANTHIDARGEYSFPGVPLRPNDLYVVTTTYSGITQGTAPITFDGRAIPPPLPITLYAGTSDPSKLVIAQAQQLLSFPAVGVMQITESIVLLNQGDRFVLSDTRAPDGRRVSVSFPLPIGARGITFTTRPTDRFLVAGNANMPVVQDTRAVLPGKAQDIIYSYQIPYTLGAPIDRDFLYPVNNFKVTLPADAQIVARGQSFVWSRIDAIDTGRALDAYVLDPVPLKDGKRLIYALDGAAQNRELVPAANNSAALFAIVVAVIVLFGIVLGVLWFRARSAAEA
jgi:hypothetical protein